MLLNKQIGKINEGDDYIDGAEFQRELLELDGMGFKNIEVSLDEVPVATYEFRGRTQKYKTGIYLPKKNQVVEVKSPQNIYKLWDKYVARWSAYVDDGYSLRIIIYRHEDIVLDEEVNSRNEFIKNILPLKSLIGKLAYNRNVGAFVR